METGSGDALLATSNPQAEKDSKCPETASLPSELAKLNLNNQACGDVPVNPVWDMTEDLHSEDSDEGDDEVLPMCSYPHGYLKRQTVYACLTCNDPTKPDWTPAGICIGCKHVCHQGHNLVSMETRRNFRCDCGNKKFPADKPCALFPNKDPKNESNVYNDHNYKGMFCSCNCKESDCTVDDPLYQCVVCEDWFHAGHSSAATDGIENNYTDLICGTCTARLDFLRYYEPFDPSAKVDDDAINEMIKFSETGSSDDESDAVAKSNASCKLEGLTKKPQYSGGCLWALGWRGKLCRCVKCKETYSSLNVSFLIDKDDETRRYFEDEDDDDNQEKICLLVRKFEEWMLQMNANERTELFKLEPEQVKAKLREYFNRVKEETGQDLLFEDNLLDQLFESFAEFILDVEGGTDYFSDVDAIEKALDPAKPETESTGDDN